MANKLNNKCLLGLGNENGVPVPLKSIDVGISIRGTIATVKSCLSYNNEEDEVVEAVFTFPVDDGSAVFGFAADIGDRHIEAEIQEKEQAEQTYDDAVMSGRTAMLLKETDSSSDVFKCSLGNLPPQTNARLSLSYVLDLKQEPDGSIRFTLPTVLNPRYSPDAGGTVAAEGATYVPPCQVPYSFSMTATVRGYHAVSTVKSDTLDLDVQLEDNNKLAKVSLREEFKFDHDLSFYVEYEKPSQPQVIFEKGNLRSESDFLRQDMLMMSFYPDLKEVSMATSGEYIFIIDRSGSMSGGQIKMAKEALLLFLKSLPPDSLFNVVSFGSTFETLFSGGSKSYDESNLEKAIQLQQSMKADMGGTEILKPLIHIFKSSPVKGHSKNVFILTDGEVSNTREVISLVKENSHKTRVFAVGIGHGVSTSLVKGMARAGNGVAEFISGQDRIQSKVIALLKLAMQQCVSDVKVTWDLPPDITAITIPDEIPASLTPGQCLKLFALIQGVDEHTKYPPSTVTLTGKQQSQPVSYSLTFDLSPDDEADEHEDVKTAPVHLLASKTQIKLLEDKYSTLKPDLYGHDVTEKTEMDQLRQQIISLSRHANIVSQMTAFVAIDKDGRIVEGSMVQRPCPVPSVSEQYLGAYEMYACPDRHTYERQDTASFCCGPSEFNVFQRDSAETLYRSANMQRNRADTRYRSANRQGLKSVVLLSCDERNKNKKGAPGLMQRLLSMISLKTHKARKKSMVFDNMEKPIGPDLFQWSLAPRPKEHADEILNNMARNVNNSDKMLAVISLQKLQGNWEISEQLCQLLDVRGDHVMNQNVDHTTAITLGVVFWLRTHFSQLHEEWQMIETKALKWLTTHGQLEDTQVEELISLIGKKLWPDANKMETQLSIK